MEKVYEKTFLRNELNQQLININQSFKGLDSKLTHIKDYYTSKNETQETPTLIKIINSIQKDFELNQNKYIDTFNDIFSIIDSFYLDIHLIIDNKNIEDINNYLNLLITTKAMIENEYTDRSTILSSTYYGNFNEIEIILTNFIKKNKTTFAIFIRSLKAILKSLKLSFNQHQVSISESFRSALDKEIEIISKNFIHERGVIINGFKIDMQTLKEDLNLEKNNINQLIKSSNSELTLLKKGLETVQENSFDLTNKINEYSNKVNNLIGNKAAELNKSLDEYIEVLKSSYDIKIKEINDSYENAKKNYQNFSALAERAGIYGLTQNYAKKAKEEKIEYQDYRRYTTFAILAAIATTVTIILIPIIEHWGMSITLDSNYYYTLMARLTISIMFFVLALYLSKQASKHYECYQENHRTYLQLAALEPFINRMSDEEQLNIRKSLIPIYFNQNKEGKFASKEDEIKLPQVISHLKNLRPLSKVNNQNKP